MQTRTDLAIESAEFFGEGPEKKGVEIITEKNEFADITVIKVKNDAAQKALGKRIGTYITIEVKEPEINTYKLQTRLSKALSEKLEFFVNRFELNKGPVLVIGLGNRYITPDSLGTGVIEKVLATHHVKKQDNAATKKLFSQMGDVCTFATGVMGITGIESAEVIKGIAKLTGACGIIVVDALAARRTSRINRAFQITDTGIVPGSGVGNRRFEISKESLGIPVIAIGVPTVVDAVTLTCDVVCKAKGLKSDPEELRDEFNDGNYDNMIVTPKNVDAAIERLSRVIADAVNMTLHKETDVNEINEFFI